MLSLTFFTVDYPFDNVQPSLLRVHADHHGAEVYLVRNKLMEPLPEANTAIPEDIVREARAGRFGPLETHLFNLSTAIQFRDGWRIAA